MVDRAWQVPHGSDRRLGAGLQQVDVVRMPWPTRSPSRGHHQQATDRLNAIAWRTKDAGRTIPDHRQQERDDAKVRFAY
jgi:hypothetical protein